MNEKVHHLPEPDIALMRQHVQFIARGMEDYCDGRIEIAYGNHENIPNQARTFGVDEIEDIVSFAVQKNKEHRNIYVVGAILSPETPLEGRSNDSHFYSSSVVWCDIDNDGKEALTVQQIKDKFKKLPPSLVIITGTKPNVRTHLWWKLAEATSDAEELREMLEGLQTNLGGDPAVKNVTSLMRLGGSVNWQTEKKRARGRETELVEIKTTAGGKESVFADTILQAYPAADGMQQSFNAGHTYAAHASTSSGGLKFEEKLADNREQYMHEMLCATIIHLTEQLGRWPSHDEVFNDAWPVYQRKVEGRDGRTIEQDNRGQKLMHSKIKSKLSAFMRGRIRSAESVEKIIGAYKAKSDESETKNQQSTNGQTEAPKPDITPTFTESIDFDSIPPREFLYHNIVARKYVTMIVAAPGAGKSILTLGIAVSAATGKAWGEWSTPQNKPIRVWMYNNEEGFDELRRRVKAVMIHEDITQTSFGGRLAINSGENRSITVAKLDDKGNVVYTPDFTAIKEQVLKNNIDLLIIDPFAETYNIKENDNDQIKSVAQLYRQIAQECSCGVILVHHARKGMGSDGAAGNADMARGGGAQIGVVRRAFTLATMGEDEAKSLGVPQDERKWFVRLDDAKSNITAPANKITWLKLKSIHINNGSGLFTEGDSVGVLTHISADDIMSEFEDRNAEEYEKIVRHLVEWMSFHKQERAKMVAAVGELMRYPDKFPYKKRKAYDMIPAAISHFYSKGGVFYEDETHFLSISEEKGAKNSLIIERKTR